ncbi:MAG: ABC transporter ATP-binding protein [Clostridia bacterium]|nr:ABC transporter ATP-binding protein [Clostridia bacterium]
MGSFLTVNNVIKTYRAGETAVNAVNGMTFSAEQGEFVVIVGPSGAGKTTVLNLLGGMDAVTSGEIVVDGTKVSDMNSKQLTLYRRNDVGFVFQFYNLMPNLTARENVELATELCKNALSPDKALELVGLSARAGNFPAQLSGGEQQRVSIARAVAKNPKILLCDEPTGALDYNTGKMVLKLLFDMCRENKKTVIVVTHNSALKDIADRVIYIKNGVAERVEQNESPKKPEEIEW